MATSWSDSAAAYIRRTDTCPRCDAVIVRADRCINCNAELTGAAATRVTKASAVAADAIAARQVAIDGMVTLPALASAPLPPPVATGPVAQAAPREGSQISVQSVLAVVGAALLGVAAIVFTFFNPDLTNFATRTTIIAVVSVVFLAGAWVLVRARLQFSAEAIGALAMVFVALDVWAFSHSAPHSVSPYVFAGIGTAFSSLVMIGIASFARVRTWLWLGLLGLSITPAWFGYAVGGTWAAIWGHLGVAAVALGAHELARYLSRRMKSPLRADHWALTTLQLVVLVVIIGQLFDVLFEDRSLHNAPAVFAGLALIAALSCRNELRLLWSYIVGAALGFAVWGLVVDLSNNGFRASAWLYPTVQLGFALVVAALAALSRIRSRTEHPRVSRRVMLLGALTLLGFGFIGEVLYGLTFYFAGLHSLPAPGWTWGLGLALGILVSAAGIFAVWGLGPRWIMPRFAFAMVVIAESIAGLALATFAGWDLLATWVQVLVALVCAVVLSLALRFAPGLSRARPSLRIPVLLTAHLLVIEAIGVTWTDPLLSQIGGAAVVVSWIAVTVAMPRALRPVWTGLGFAYALIVFAHVMQLAHESDVAILSLTAALASASAIVITLVRRVPASYWYAVLIVTAVPFVLGVGDVLFLRSQWTALSTGVTFVLALTILLTTRPGLSQYLRAVAAALLVPSLAVVVVDVGAWLLKQSASPITLPAIAVIVACVLPSTNLIGAALVRRGHAESDARLSRLWIEISSLVTGGLAVILALVRAAAGLNTSFLVLLIIGIGAAATAVFTHRRYGWIVAAASWTGALWSYWGIQDVHVIELYLLPPAIAAVIVGAVSVIRRLPGVGLYAVGLFCAAVPTLTILAVNGNDSTIPWRMLGLIGGSLVLVILGTFFVSRPADSRLRILATPTLVVGILAAAGGVVQAIRAARGLDTLWQHPHDPRMIVVLELSVVAAALATQGARMLATPDRIGRARWRWIYMPAVLYLAIGPIFAVRATWFSLWTMLALTVLLLAFMIGTVLRAKKQAVALPPVWFTFAVAWSVAVAGWSTRLLRVEAFSLPLGVALIAVGVIVMIGKCEPVRRGFTSWPVGFNGSWRVLSPGMAVLFLPSILATGTDPQTWRAIMVIALALLAILTGSLRKLGAPFILGIVVLPLENITVFAAQIGHTISATSWWITLATAGAVLLVIAVTYERRTGGERGVAARLRDLR